MSRGSNHSAEEKIRIAEACLSGKIGVCEAGRRAESPGSRYPRPGCRDYDALLRERGELIKAKI